MPDFIGNYTTSPNAEILGLLSQENEAARNRAASLASRFGGGSESYAGSGSNVSLTDILSGLSKADSREVRQRYMDMMFKRMENREALGMQQAQMDMNMVAMDQVAKKRMQLLLEEKQVRAKLAFAGADTRAHYEEALRKNQEATLDLHEREISSKALLAQQNETAAKEYATRLREVETTAGAMKGWRGGIAKTVSPEGMAAMLQEYMANPSKGGAVSIGGMEELGGHVAKSLEWLGELFTGDTAAQAHLSHDIRKSQNAGSDTGLALLSEAAANNPVFMEAFTRAAGNSGEVLDYFKSVQNSGKAGAEKFTAHILSDFAIKALTNSGMNVDVPASTPAMQKLIGEILDLSNSPNIPPEDMSDRVYNALRNASQTVFGAAEGDKGIAKLADALDVVFENTAGLTGQMSAGILGPKNYMGVEQMRNAAAAYAFGRASQARHVLKTGTIGRIFTLEQLESTLGRRSQVLDPKTGQFQPGLLPLETTTQVGRGERQILGPEVTKQVQQLLQLMQNQKAAEAASALKAVELGREKLRLEGEAQTRGVLDQQRAQMAILDELIQRERETESTDLSVNE